MRLEFGEPEEIEVNDGAAGDSRHPEGDQFGQGPEGCLVDTVRRSEDVVQEYPEQDVESHGQGRQEGRSQGQIQLSAEFRGQVSVTFEHGVSSPNRELGQCRPSPSGFGYCNPAGHGFSRIWRCRRQRKGTGFGRFRDWRPAQAVVAGVAVGLGGSASAAISMAAAATRAPDMAVRAPLLRWLAG